MTETPGGTTICLCPHCLTPAQEAGPCQVCGHVRLTCRPGSWGDARRKPLMTAAGEIKTQAPVWWLCNTVGALAETAAGGRPQRAPE